VLTFCSILCTHIKYCKTSTQSKLNRFTGILTCVILWEVAFLFVAVYQLFYICDCQWHWSSEQPVSGFSPTVHFKNECLNIHTYILFVSIFSYINTPLCITLHTQIQECCWGLKNSASRKISRKFVSWNSAEKMWLAGFSAEFLLSQLKLNKKNSAEGSIIVVYCTCTWRHEVKLQLYSWL